MFVSYFLNVISELSEETDVLKYVSVFTLADIRNVIVDVKINPHLVIVAFGLTILFIGLTVVRYKKKELV